MDVEPADKGENYIWHNLYGIDAYVELHKVSDNPLNLCLYYLSDKHKKTFLLHKKSFDMEKKIVLSQYEMIDKETPKGEDFDPLVIENVRLYELAQGRADRLEKAYEEIKTLRGILPICASCKKIRDDEGYWEQVEVCVGKRTGVDFSHGLCPECYEKAMQDLLLKDD